MQHSPEEVYERRIAALEAKYDGSNLDIAIATVEAHLYDLPEDVDGALDAAREAVFDDLIACRDWEPIEAADISDIAGECAERAYAQVRAWEQ